MAIVYSVKENDKGMGGQSAYVWRVDDAAEAAQAAKAAMPEGPNGYAWGGSRGRRGGGDSWLGNESPQAALDYATSGNDALVAAAQALVDKVEGAHIETTGRVWAAAPCGAYPIVPDFLSGRPDCMRRRVSVEAESCPVRIYADTTSSAGISAEDLQQRGAAILALVMLAARVRPVELWQVTTLDAKGGGRNLAAFATRCPTSPLNLGVCAHLLTSQAWTRGVGYGWDRKHTNSGGQWPFGIYPDNGGAQSRKANAYMRCALDMEGDDIYVPAICLRDELIARPLDWINARLKDLGVSGGGDDDVTGIETEEYNRR